MNLFYNTKNYTIIAIFLIILDAISTIIGIGWFGATELNIINTLFFNTYISIAMSHVVIMFLIYHLFITWSETSFDDPKSKFIKYELFVIAYFYFIVVVNNFSAILLEILK